MRRRRAGTMRWRKWEAPVILSAAIDRLREPVLAAGSSPVAAEASAVVNGRSGGMGWTRRRCTQTRSSHCWNHWQGLSGARRRRGCGSTTRRRPAMPSRRGGVSRMSAGACTLAEGERDDDVARYRARYRGDPPQRAGNGEGDRPRYLAGVCIKRLCAGPCPTRRGAGVRRAARLGLIASADSDDVLDQAGRGLAGFTGFNTIPAADHRPRRRAGPRTSSTGVRAGRRSRAGPLRRVPGSRSGDVPLAPSASATARWRRPTSPAKILDRRGVDPFQCRLGPSRIFSRRARPRRPGTPRSAARAMRSF